METFGLSNNYAYNVSMNNLYDKIVWLQEDSKIIQLSQPLTDDGFVLANLDASGFYRVNYDEKSWLNIIKQLNANKDVIDF